jgi:hypothetical protein
MSASGVPPGDAARTADCFDCTQALLASYRALDQGDLERVAAGFATDGVWMRQGHDLRGPGEVLAALRARPAGRVSVHLLHNVAVDVVGVNDASLEYVLVAYSHDGGAEAPPPPAGRPAVLAWQRERMRREAGRWLTVHRTSTPVFQG